MNFPRIIPIRSVFLFPIDGVIAGFEVLGMCALILEVPEHFSPLHFDEHIQRFCLVKLLFVWEASFCQTNGSHLMV